MRRLRSLLRRQFPRCSTGSSAAARSIPLRYVALRIADDVAYGAGAWTGAIEHRSAGRARAEVHELAGESWRLMSLHSSHTSAGIQPHRIKRLKTMQPRQIANTDSSVAATIKPAINTYDDDVHVRAPRPAMRRR